MAEKIFEKVSEGKVRDTIKKEGFTAAREVIERKVSEFESRGFDPSEIRTIIREGVKEAVK